MSRQPRILADEQLTEYSNITHLLGTIIENGVSKVRRTPKAAFEAALQSTVRDGREIELRTTTTHIQWRYVGEAWSNLIALSELVGPPGPEGPAGQAGNIPVALTLNENPVVGQQVIVGNIYYVCVSPGIWSKVSVQEVITSSLISAMLTDNPLWMFSLKEAGGESLLETISNTAYPRPSWMTLNALGTTINTRMVQTNTNPGNNGFLVMPEINSPDTAWTVEAVVLPTASTPFVGNDTFSLTTANNKNLIGSAQGGNGRRAAILQVGTNGIAVGEHGPNWASQRLAHAVSIQSRAHVALVLQSSTYRIYLNGVEVASGPSSQANIAIPNTVLGVGFGSFEGFFSDIAGYNYPLSAARIMAHAQAAGLA
ncbi:MAG: hypothetical protein KatS3mg071_2742 [Meiothermus sp.]|nr:MAG: hypothetical protein KatS3mg071_2742 [Meiothermus sp.]